uniref:hypothetical protein n=2 Tax=Eggerthella TaxID=84111 RepID=UPI001E507A6E
LDEPHAVQDKQGTSRLGWSKELSAPPKVDSDDFSHKKWALACANAQNQTHYLSYKPLEGDCVARPRRASLTNSDFPSRRLNHD